VESGLAGSAESEAAGNHAERYGALDDACDHVARLPERFDRADEVADLARTARLL
jgi:hypothetical protein